MDAKALYAGVKEDEDKEITLDDTNGMLLRQSTQPLECCLQKLGICYITPNEYKLAKLPTNKYAMRNLGDSDGWTPTQEEIDHADLAMIGKEDSLCCVRVCLCMSGCANLRPFEMQFKGRDGGNLALKLERSFTFGGKFCFPHTMDVRLNGHYIGKVEEDWNITNWCDRCCEATLCCNIPYKLKLSKGENQYEDRYDINVSYCLFGPHNNYCAATPCRPNILFEVYENQGNKVAYETPRAWIQKTYGRKGGCQAFTRWLCCKADNYIVEWPDEATSEDRALFVGATVLLDYIFYENQKVARLEGFLSAEDK